MKTVAQQLAEQQAAMNQQQVQREAKRMSHQRLKGNILKLKKKKGKVWRNWMRQIGLDPDETVNSS